MLEAISRRKYTKPALRSRKPRPLDRAKAHRLLELVRAHADARQVDAALDAAISAVVWNPADKKIRMELAKAFYSAGLFDEALSWALGLGDDAQACFLAGCVYSDLGQHTQAAQSFSLALQLDPGMTQARLRRAWALLVDGQNAEALKDIDLLLATNPQDVLARTMRSNVLLDQGHAKEALDDLDAIAQDQLTPVHAMLHTRCAVLAGVGQDLVDGIFKSYLRLFPHHAQLRSSFAHHLSSRKDVDPGALQRSKEEYSAILEMKNLPRRTEAQACFSLAELEMESSEDQALALFRRGLDLMPDHPQGLAGVGRMYLRRSRPDRAMPWLLRSVMSEPNRQETIELMAEALCGIKDEDASSRWLALLFSGLPTQAPLLMARTLGHVQDRGRAEAYMDVRRLAHRMKNRVAVLASRVRTGLDTGQIEVELDDLYEQWARFLDSVVSANSSMSPLSVKVLVNKAVEQIAETHRGLVLSLNADYPLVSGNEQQLVDALANIISNAIQASSPDDKVHIAARSSDGGDFVEIAVMDYGQGIDNLALSRVFTPGYTTRAKGSGVGLFVARNVVQAHGGKVSISSAPGGPTTFIVRLPSVAGSESPSVGILDELMGSSFAGGQIGKQR